MFAGICSTYVRMIQISHKLNACVLEYARTHIFTCYVDTHVAACYTTQSHVSASVTQVY